MFADGFCLLIISHFHPAAGRRKISTELTAAPKLLEGGSRFSSAAAPASASAARMAHGKWDMPFCLRKCYLLLLSPIEANPTLNADD